ncbi:MAG: SpoIIE family protein phosphatase [Nitrospirae bacterium]|nr:SpoIIE family protein phosphatase [Nitrospirota bacterium]
MENCKKKSGTVLVVDDQKMIREICSVDLKKEGYVVLLAANGIECLDIARANKGVIDLIILDIMMPKLDGYATLEQLRADPELQKIPVVMLTGKAEGEDAVRALELGADDYIRKPFDMAEFLARVKIFVRRRHLERLLLQNIHNTAVLQRRLLTSEDKVRKIFDPLGWNVAIFNRPAYEVSGDFFYPKPVGDKSGGFLLADATGHGTSAAMLSMRVLSKIEDLLSPVNNAGEFLGAINTDILPIMKETDSLALAAIYAIFNEKSVILSNAGLPWPIMVDNSGTASRIPLGGGFPLGISDALYSDTEISMPFGSRLILYTDGIIEAMNEEASIVYTTERLLKAVQKHYAASLLALPQLLAEEVKTFTGRDDFDDDVTIIAFERAGCAQKMEGKCKFDGSNENVARFLDDFKTEVVDFFTSDEKLSYRINYCLLEVVNNAVEHGNLNDQQKFVTVEWQIHDRTLEIIVTDEGKGFAPKIPEAPPPLSQPRGRGLYSIQKYTSNLQIEGNKLTICFER